MKKKRKYESALITGHFNILHPGHIRIFKFAKSIAKNLTIGVEPNEFNKESIFIDEKERLDSINQIELVDNAFIFKKNLENAIKKTNPDIIIKGQEHASKNNPEDEYKKQYKFDLIFCSGETTFSSNTILEKEINKKFISYPKSFMDRNKINKNKIITTLDKFKKINVIVIGDLIVDEYIDCDPLGMSQEDPTIVVSPISSKKYIGGAGIVALHSLSMGANVKLISCLGNDQEKDFVTEELKKYNLQNRIFTDKSRMTTLKQRYKTNDKTLLRVSNLHNHPINTTIEKRILEYINKEKNKIDLIILSDFNYGVLSNSLLDKIQDFAKKNDIVITADSQSSSQIGDISRFKNMDIISSTEREARIATKNNEDGVVVMIEKLRELSNADNIILKLGADGLMIQNYIEGFLYTEKIEALNTNPIDVSGAGDSFLAASSIAYTATKNINLASLIGSLAAAIQVSQIGNVPISQKLFINQLQ
jgi:rfaE bifunctional protein kinase chain/domain